jgi:hypothetical protein
MEVAVWKPEITAGPMRFMMLPSCRKPMLKEKMLRGPRGSLLLMPCTARAAVPAAAA